MDSARLKELASYNLVEGFMPVNKFADMGPNARGKLLWQWASAKQMDFRDWMTYLQAHSTEQTREGGFAEAVKTETKE